MPGALAAVLAETARRRRAERALATAFSAWGYDEVSVPVLQPAEGEEAWGGAYRVIDQDGALLALRPDLTGPIARLVAAGDDGPGPRRLFYLAALFRRGGPAGPREIWQAGAELIGAGGPAADAEALALCLDALAALGLPECRIAVGDVAWQRRLCGGVDGSEQALLRRDFVALAQAFGGGVPAPLLWRGSAAAALDGAGGPAWPAAGESLRATLALLVAAGLGEAIDVEPALCRPGGYYTGLVFEVSHPDLPRPLGGGGRYDGLLAGYGRPRPAVGFALDFEQALAVAPAAPAADRGGGVVLAPGPGEEAEAMRRARELRQAGERVVVDCVERTPGERAVFASASGCREVWLGRRRVLLPWA